MICNGPTNQQNFQNKSKSFFSGSFFKEPYTAEISSESVLNFLSQRFSFYVRNRYVLLEKSKFTSIFWRKNILIDYTFMPKEFCVVFSLYNSNKQHTIITIFFKAKSIFNTAKNFTLYNYIL